MEATVVAMTNTFHGITSHIAEGEVCVLEDVAVGAVWNETESPSTFTKDHTPRSSGFCLWNAGMVKHLKNQSV